VKKVRESLMAMMALTNVLFTTPAPLTSTIRLIHFCHSSRSPYYLLALVLLA
jgi:hypothetical protein